MAHGAPSAAYRYAVSFAPHPGSLGWLAGSHWLGRCAALLQPLEQRGIAGVSADDLHRLTAAPRRRGWQAPLLAPFALAPGTDWLSLHQAVQALAHSLMPCVLPTLHVERVGDVLALVLPASHAANSALQETAAAGHAALHRLAAPPSGIEPLRSEHPLAQQAFRFHLPLTGPLQQVDAQTQTLVFDAAQEYFSDLPPLKFNSLALFAEPTPGADFVLLDHVEMTP
ncbi:hypothetical protein ASE52_22865 [Acidovorax sp. Root275]|uniref:DUF1045 domain-containing protein n=1 Tax=Acidovorax sp. Root275 TaxID=1736508 RepID=UPI00070DC676|nr:DUF1045 domain-containing protein [Acidovorax sp. Root275]KRD42482.1 hypothetical protein ASE52_22865 [Acidovorax sp. Root275]